MISASNVTLAFGKRVLFKDVNISFTPGNCYGLIGANGSGKSTFLKVLSGDIESNTGEINIEPNKRLSFLEQDQFKYDKEYVKDLVIMGHQKLFHLSKERDDLYSKSEFTEEEGNRIGEIEAEFAELNGYEAESEVGILLNGLGLPDTYQDKQMAELEAGEKVKVLIAKALFGNPDILLLDEPTNNLDIKSIEWLEEFLFKFNNTVIVVSHDRHFLNKVCTHITDIDWGEIKIFLGNYSFWQQSVQLMVKQKKQQNRKNEEKVKELQDFISRFSANASKAKQATARKKMIDKLDVSSMPHSSRRFPFIEFKPFRECGDIILNIDKLNVTVDGVQLLNDFNLTVNANDKIAFVGEFDLARTALFDIINGELEADSGTVTWGVTIRKSYFPKNNEKYFESGYPIVDWLRQYSKERDETFIRSFLGRLLFSGEEALKSTSVLSGGEKVRCMLSKIMVEEANVLVMDEPTNHLDLEAITSLNDAIVKFPEVMLFSSHDHQLIQSTANRIIEITPNGVIDKQMKFDEYIHNEEIQNKREDLYQDSVKS